MDLSDDACDDASSNDSNHQPRPSRGDLRRRLPAEQAFRAWAAMGPMRSWTRVAEAFDVKPSTVLRLARKMRWTERLAALEKPAREAEDEKLRVAVKDMNERMISLGQDLVRKGADALGLLMPTAVPEALRLIEVGAKLERQALGEPDSKKQVTVETILRERFEKLVVLQASSEQRKRPATITVQALDDEEIRDADAIDAIEVDHDADDAPPDVDDAGEVEVM